MNYVRRLQGRSGGVPPRRRGGGRPLSGKVAVMDRVSRQGDSGEVSHAAPGPLFSSPNLQGWRLAGKTKVDGRQVAFLLPARRSVKHLAFIRPSLEGLSRAEEDAAPPSTGPAEAPASRPLQPLPLCVMIRKISSPTPKECPTAKPPSLGAQSQSHESTEAYLFYLTFM